ERCTATDQCLLVRRERLAYLGQHFFIAASKAELAANGRDARGRRAHLARLEEGPDALCGQAVARTVPAKAAIEADVEKAGRVAVSLLDAEGARLAVLEGLVGNVTGGAEDRAGARERRIEEQALAQRDRFRLC